MLLRVSVFITAVESKSGYLSWRDIKAGTQGSKQEPWINAAYLLVPRVSWLWKGLDLSFILQNK